MTSQELIPDAPAHGTSNSEVETKNERGQGGRRVGLLTPATTDGPSTSWEWLTENELEKQANTFSECFEMVDIHDRAMSHQEALSKAMSRGRTPTRLKITIKPMVIDKEDPQFVAKWETAIRQSEQKLANILIEHLKETATKTNLAIRELGKETLTLKAIDPSRAKDVIDRTLEEAQVKRNEKQENRKKRKAKNNNTVANKKPRKDT